MQRNISLKWSLIVIGIAGVALASVFVLVSNVDPSAQGSYVKQSILPTRVSAVGLPVRFSIPTIKVDAAVEYVGVTPQGAVGVPKGPTTVAWFNLGPRPGEAGSAVIVGHFGWKGGVRAVFDDLHKLKKGDKVYVTDEKGTIVTFVVRESKRYVSDADAPAVFGSSDGKAHLNLITCEGTWDKVSKSYSNRLVVFTDKEDK